MIPVQGITYTIPNGSTRLYLRKIKYKGDKYAMCCIEIIHPTQWIIIDTIKNCKLYYDKINHWRRI